MSDARSPRPSSSRYVPRFAGEVFRHQNNPSDGYYLRKLASEVAWKKNPAADMGADMSGNSMGA